MVQVNGVVGFYVSCQLTGKMLMLLFTLDRRQAIVEPLRHFQMNKRRLYFTYNAVAYSFGFGVVQSLLLALNTPTRLTNASVQTEA